MSAGWRSDEMSPSPMGRAPVRGRRRRELSFFWAMLPVLTLGIATPFLIAFAARRLRSRTLGWCSAGWLAAVIGWFSLGASSRIFYTGAFSAAYNLLISMTMVAGSFQAFALRPVVFRLDTLDGDRRTRRQASLIVAGHPKE
jgi:hypothetical protein